MLKRANIRTRLVTCTETGEEAFTTQAEGGCLGDASGVMLRYAEAGNHGTATLVASSGLAQLRRKGDVTSRLVFAGKKLIPAGYSAMGQNMDFSVFTHSLSLVFTPQGGQLEVRFTLLLAGTQVADSILEIRWDLL